jgi:glycosyltransferase involved in cell wall biosynthesis
MKVLMAINTTGLVYDDRLRKESLSLLHLGFDVEILAMEDANQARQAMAYDQIPATTIRLRSRVWFARSQGLWVKASEMYLRFLRAIFRSRPDIIWFHNIGLSGLVPVLALLKKTGFVRRLVWDQHELPKDRILRERIFMRAFGWLLNHCDCIIMANEERRDLVQKMLGSSLRRPIEVLNNYPDQVFLNAPRTGLPTAVRERLAGNRYLLAQGGASPNRHLDELVEALLRTHDLRLVVVGPYRAEQIDELKARHGDAFSRQVLFTGFLPQMDVLPFIDHALASVVFYAQHITNSRLCAPNRLYQAICRGTPVVVSSNPPMRMAAEQHGFGIVVNPSSPSEIADALTRMAENLDAYRRGALAASGAFVWENQLDSIRRAVQGATLSK